MKTLIKLLIVAAILNAAARAGYTALKYYQFRDAAQEFVMFGATTPTEQIQRQIVEKAKELEVPVPAESVVVTRDGARTRAEATYTEAVELFPRYPYPIPFSFSVDAFAMGVSPP